MTNRQLIQEWRRLAGALRDAWLEFNSNDPLRMAGATAFFTTFALPAIMVILIQLLGLLFDANKISHRLFLQLEGIIGVETTATIIDALKAFRSMAQHWWITIGGFIFLLFVATTLFRVIRASLNQLWMIRLTGKQGIWQAIRSRGRGVLIIVLAGVLFVIDFTAEAIASYLGKYIQLMPALLRFYNSALSYVISVVVVTLWFALVFYLLPDGRPPRRIALMGGLVTGVLFSIGKLVLHWLLTYSSINSIYGASASIVLLLLFVFYVSMIFYYGAAFTRAWANRRGTPIIPLPHAARYRFTAVAEEDTPAVVKY